MLSVNAGGGVTVTIEGDVYGAVWHQGQEDEVRVSFTADYYGDGKHHEGDFEAMGDEATARIAMVDGSPIVFAFNARDGFGYGWNLDHEYDSEYGTAPFPVDATGKCVGDFNWTCDDADPDVICGNWSIRSVSWAEPDVELDAWFLAKHAYDVERGRAPVPS
jgi:hypothetical protein